MFFITHPESYLLCRIFSFFSFIFLCVLNVKAFPAFSFFCVCREVVYSLWCCRGIFNDDAVNLVYFNFSSATVLSKNQ